MTMENATITIYRLSNYLIYLTISQINLNVNFD